MTKRIYIAKVASPPITTYTRLIIIPPVPAFENKNEKKYMKGGLAKMNTRNRIQPSGIFKSKM